MSARPPLRPALGVATCLVLLAAVLLVSPQAWVAGLATLAAGSAYYPLRPRLRR